MNFKSSFTLFFLVVSVFAFSKKQEIVLGKIKLMNDLIEIKIPTHFSALLDHEVKQHYGSGKKPKVAYADSLREVRISFYVENYNTMKDPGLGPMKADVLNGFLKNDLKLKELSNGIEVVDGRDVGFLGILHKSPEKFYRFYFLTLHKELVLSGELISPKKGYKNWIPVASEIMKSLDIKGN